jgi:hypothetical protein
MPVLRRLTYQRGQLDTPVGKFDVPEGIQAGLDATTDDELIAKMFEVRSTGFIEPFVFNELMARGLYLRYIEYEQAHTPQPPKREFMALFWEATQ